MWGNYAIRYIKENKLASIFLAVITFIAATLLSTICGVLYNLWTDYVVRQQIMNGSVPEKGGTVLIYGVLLVVVCIALISMIHNAFAVSMSSRLHQLGILQSVGATPRQIRAFLIKEAAVLCVAPALVGVLLGILECYGFMQLMIAVTEAVRRYDVIFQYHPLVAVGAFGITFVTILISAWFPAVKISGLTPLEAIYYGGEEPNRKVRKFRIFSKIFGVYGELARRSLYTRKKELRTTAISLALSFLAFITFISLETISGISTKRTYFERYADVWDLQLAIERTVENTEPFGGAETVGLQNTEWQNDKLLTQIRELDGVESCTAYQKMQTVSDILEQMLSDEVKAIGLENLREETQKDATGAYQMAVYLYILDDMSYEKYCKVQNCSVGEGAIAVNKIWDSVHSEWTDRAYLPLLKEEAWELPIAIADYANEMPAIREEFDQSGLTLILSETYYRTVLSYTNEAGTKQQINSIDGKRYYNIIREKAEPVEETTLELSNEEAVKRQIEAFLADDVSYTIEGRLEEEKSNDDMRSGFKIVVGAVAALFAAIGISNMFSATLGQIYQRKKEFARYLSVGMAPNGMKKIFCMEALVLALRPLCGSLLINIPIAVLALYATNISWGEFVKRMPWAVIGWFFIGVLGLVGLAYYLAGRKICSENLIEVLKDETMI